MYAGHSDETGQDENRGDDAEDDRDRSGDDVGEVEQRHEAAATSRMPRSAEPMFLVIVSPVFAESPRMCGKVHPTGIRCDSA